MRKVLTLILVAVSTGAAAQTGVRDVTALGDVIPITARIKYTTMIVFPEGEDIIDIDYGDKDGWTVTSIQNMAHIKAKTEGARTSLHLVTTSGRVYSFLLEEKKIATPDLRVTLIADTPAVSTNGGKKFYTTADMDALRADLSALQAELASTKQATQRIQESADHAIANAVRQAPLKMRFAYEVPYLRPFLVRAMWHDDKFTYIKTDAPELPAIYEIKDGKGALINVEAVPVNDGSTTFVITKILERGYFKLGDKELRFQARVIE